MTKTRQIIILITLLLTAGVEANGQKEKPIPACRQTTFAAIKPVPKLEYDCPEDLIDSDDKVLRLPGRLAAIRNVVTQLEAFTDPGWWQADVDEVNACQVHGRVGQLTDEEKQEWKQRGYNFDFYGNHQMRLALVTDPCYQNGYNGSILFLLYRKDGKVFASQLLNGYYSRVDNSVGIDFATLNGQQLIELSTANSMPPTLINFYFVIDRKTNKTMRETNQRSYRPDRYVPVAAIGRAKTAVPLRWAISFAISEMRSIEKGFVTTQSTFAVCCSFELTASPQPVITAMGIS